ncbi:uncharacterized protein TRIREDRAFT_102383 [Trichoderma reesei QM6a]|uniref:Predicted protein n=1 Tax=Hypocrea jecorina (strain QM6a) TaxID=431241 RepID=G0R8Y4_HYPJQ|nr:uncharacterized protein TRIREDRAFT_102383 [Trichoderma reesei QM6a]EGR52634.1 predicted protein [Trichoderma reesei QM6a]
MVQYVFTPWRDRQELLLVREQFYGSGALTQPVGASGRIQGEEGQGLNQGDARRGTTAAAAAASTNRQASREQADGEKHKAVGRVSMWMQRGNCPHMVESTALLMAAVLSDEAAAAGNAGASTYAVRAAYAAAFSRFVTGLLDGHQDKLRKQSMYSIAKNIGLPATFVELRHQATHEQLPSLAKLRSAARKALDWIWDYYWKHLGEAEKAKDPCDMAAMANEASGLEPENRQASEDEGQEQGLEQEQDADRSPEPTTGWSRYSGVWKPKPIGVV